MECMAKYNHLKIEKKWQKEWVKKKVYQAKDLSKKPKYYALIEFPYPSGDGLHVGHPRPYIGMDLISRKKRMEGYNVLYPIGWDAFGLPTENYAIKTGKDPRVVTKQNSDTFRRQIKSLGISFDWSREINTTDPKYYKWTQWIFLQFLKKGLAYKAKMTINWCPSCKIGLANEEVVAGACERCGTAVEKREKEQWMLAITKYADRLDKDLDTVDYLPHIKLSQKNWIGRSEGINLKCRVKDSDISFEVYDSVPQTFMAQTFTVVAPDHPLLKKLVEGTGREKEILSYAEKMITERAKLGVEYVKEVDGIFTGRYVWYEPAQRDLPIWVASYAIMGYGSGVVNCSAHDERDFIFAKKFNISLHEVAEPLFINTGGVDSFQEGQPFSEREAVSIIIKHWSEDKYLGLKSKNVHWAIFPTGGLEKGERPEEAANREIKEETGYVNFKLVKKIGRSHAKFYHVQKKENVFAHFTSFYFELKNGEQNKITEEENQRHSMMWLAPDDVENFLTQEGQKRDWKILQGTEEAVVKNGILAEPAEFKDREWFEVREDIIDYIVKKGWGKRKMNFKLRDWVFSRQRYWGEPIPVVHCENCGIVPLPEKDLPLLLPKVKNYQPTDNGESPLAKIDKWVNVKCPKCKRLAKRETDTMPNWAGSSWYYLRYTNPKNNKEFASQKNLKYWTPVDWYNGGNEHTTLHLLYSRFWHKFLYDLKLVPTSEPYMKRTSHGLILAEGGEKMSKSKGNVINPDDIVERYGADTLRLYEMFMGPFDQAIAWSEEAIIGPRRFLERVWKFQFRLKENKVEVSQFIINSINLARNNISRDIESMKFNTAVSQLMILLNYFEKQNITIQIYETFLQLLAPLAPHITEEIWFNLGHKKSIHLSDWPRWRTDSIQDEEIKIVVQVNGKVRAQMFIPIDTPEENIKEQVLKDKAILKYTMGKDIKRVVYVKNRLINIVM